MTRTTEHGFSLIEILLSLAIVALLFTGMFMTLDQVVRARNDMSNQATPYVVGPAILDVIARDLSNVYFYDFKDNNTFYGADASLIGREADALSFVTFTKAFAPHTDLEAEDEYGQNRGRYAFANEVSFVCRQARGGFLELWRREDFFVDESPHTDGDYVLLYDKIHSLQLKYISRNTDGEEGVGGATEKNAEQMLQDGWNSVEEQGVPRAVLVILEIYARDRENEVETELANDDQVPRIYRFTRYLTLPQVHMSRESEQQIANWDGEYQEATAVTATNAPAANAGGGGRGGRGGRGRGGADGGGRGRGQNGRGRSGRANGNPFLNALQGRGNSSGGASSSGASPFSGLFGGGRR